MKRFLSLLLTCAMLLSLAACGKKDPGGSSSGGGSTSGSTSGDPDASCPDPKDALYALYYTTMSTFVASQQLRESIEQQYGQPDAPANGGGGEYLLSSSGFEGNAIVLMPAGQAARLYQQSSGQYQMLAITNLCGPQPVSYTHLDVYKRQVYDGVPKGGTAQTLAYARKNGLVCDIISPE